MTPTHWKGAGLCCLAVAALLVIAATLSMFAPVTISLGQLGFLQYQVSRIPDLGTDQLRGIAQAALAGVMFFLGLGCFAWSGLAEARQQRAEILAELAALRRLAERDNPPAGTNPQPPDGAERPASEDHSA